MSLEYLLIGDDEDEILAQVREESLRHYRDFELPRIQNGTLVAASDSIESSRDAGEFARKSPQEAGKLSEKNVEPSNSSILCTQVGGKAGALLYEGEEAKGFHLAAGTSYIYPTNFPIRQYQAAIVRSALFKNTLVSLPTGLGKTFIAAVVMFNFYRWFPHGKVVFMAPTRPLVAQQIKACYSIMGISPEDTTEMTGIQAADVREKLWNEKRVFFLTPQVMANDLRSNICPADLVKCLVIDEAHKAVKDYAYCQVVKSLSAASAVYRTLALSATPGNDINAVIQVIKNLNICCLEMRGEDSIDVAPYTHGKSVEQVVVDLSPEIIRVKEDFMQVYERFARSLIENRVLTNNIAYLSKFQILKAMEKFRANPPRGMSAPLIGSLVSDFTMCMTFAHALELMQIYGLRAFYRYLADESGEKTKAATTRLKNNDDLQRMLKKLHAILYPKPGSDVPYTWGHPKLKKLVTSLSDHFKAVQEKGEKTKAIVFCNYKIVVNEIVDLLGQCKPHIQAALFVGQSGGKEKGMPQAKQLQIMKDFRDGKINCLVATCVAEEGLDIGEVDLIVLMESQKSPVRLVQRLGRTGRKRRGRCIVLLTRGKEETKFHEAMASRKSYVKNIVDSKAVKNSLCQYSPPMFPPDMKPQQQLVHIKVITAPTPTKPVKQNKKQMDIRDCTVPEERPFLDEEAAQKIIEELGGTSLSFNQLPIRTELWHRRMDPAMKVDELFDSASKNSLASWNDWNTEVHKAFVISNTTSSSLYCRLMSYSPQDEDIEYLKLVEDFEARGVETTEDSNLTKHVGKVAEEIEDKKPGKKKIVPKKNYGMDIRSCMAVAMERANKKPRLDLSDDDVILINDEDCGMVCDLQENAEGVDTDMKCSPITTEVPKQAETRPMVVGGGMENELDIAALFDMKRDDFENLLYGGDLLCGLEDDVDLCYRLGKFMGDPKYVAEKPRMSMDVDAFGFQCDQFLGLMDGIREIALGTTATRCQPDGDADFKIVKSPIATNTNSPETHIHSNSMSEPKIEHNNLNDSFVGVDDLFGDDDFFQAADQNAPGFRECASIANTSLDICQTKMAATPVKTPPYHKGSGLENIGEISPIVTKKNDTYSSVWGSNLELAGRLTPSSTKKCSNSSKPIVSSTPINPNLRKRELFCASGGRPINSEKDEWLLDDILEEEEISKGECSIKPICENTPALNSFRDLFSSPPAGKVFQTTASDTPFKEPAAKTPVENDFEEDFWCMDDLFDDEQPEVLNNRDSKDETTLYGITQMVSQIERDKNKNREVAKKGDVIEILDSSSPSPIWDKCGATDSKLHVPSKQEDQSKLEMRLDSTNLSSTTSNLKLKSPTKTNIFTSVLNKSDSLVPNETFMKDKAISICRKPSDSDQIPSKEKSLHSNTSANKLNGGVSPKKPLSPLLEFDSPNMSDPKFPDTSSSSLKVPSKPFQENIPIYIIDSDSNGSAINEPQPSTSKGIDEQSSKDPSTKDKDVSSYSLLSEDDDVFNFLVNDENFLGEKISNPSTKSDASKPVQNFKKYKPKNSSLLSHLDSEPDNDFPPEKRNLDPDETIHLKVGSMSRKKLSFEDMLNELDDSTTSKYFASNKTTAEPTNRNISNSGSKNQPFSKLSCVQKAKILELDDDDDIFIQPAQKTLGGRATCNNESSTTSSSSSPVKKIKKKKKGNLFIEREAEESGILSSDDSDNSSLDQMDNSFVNDASDQDESYAHYLKSVKSPVRGGKFKIPTNKVYLDNVYSQVVNDAEEDYENDSFCVDSNEEHSGDETTILELAERKLASRKPSRKKFVDPISDDSDAEGKAVNLESTALPKCTNNRKRRYFESDSDHTPERVPKKMPRNRIISPIEENISPRSGTVENVVPSRYKSLTEGSEKSKTIPTGIMKQTVLNPNPITLGSDSDDELQEAIRRSVLEAKEKTPEELKFEEDLQKALLLSQCEVKGPSTFLRNGSSRNSEPSHLPGDPGPSGLLSKPGRSGLHSNSGASDLHSNPGPSGISVNSTKRDPFSNIATQNPPPPSKVDIGTSFLFMSQPMMKDWKPLSTKSKLVKPSKPNTKKPSRIFELSDDSD